MPASTQSTKPPASSGRDRLRSGAVVIGDGDKVIAERFRTKLCRNFAEKGSCPYESRCMFAHGRHQLRTKQLNLRDGLTSEEAIRHFKQGMIAQKLRKVAGAHTPTPPPPPTSDVVAEPVNQEESVDFSLPSTGNSSPTSEHTDLHVVGAGDSVSELNSSVVRDHELSEARASPELTLHSLCWYRRNPYDWNNTIVLSPSATSSRASGADPTD